MISLMTAAVAINVATYIFTKGGDWLFSKSLDALVDSYKSDPKSFAEQLEIIIDESIKEFKVNHATKKNKNQKCFYEHETFVKELLKYSFTKEIDEKSIFDSIDSASDIVKPTQEDITVFLKIFIEKVDDNEQLKEINLKENLTTDIVNIYTALDNGFKSLNTKLDEIRESQDVVMSELGSLRNELKDSVEPKLLIEWEQQIVEISQHLNTLQPKTAIKRLSLLKERIENEGKLSSVFEAKIAYLLGRCHSELLGGDVYEKGGKEYILAETLVPNNDKYKKAAAIAYLNSGDNKKSMELSEELLTRDKNSLQGWLVRCYLKNESAIEYFNEVPIEIFNNKNFQLNIVNWLFNKKYVTSINHAQQLGFNLLDFNNSSGIQIDFSNRKYWTIWLQLQLAKYFQNNVIVFDINTTSRKSELEKIYNFLGDILSFVDGTEVEEDYIMAKFQYHFIGYILTGDKSEIKELKKIFSSANINEPSYVSQYAMALANMGDNHHISESIQVIDNYKGEKGSSMVLHKLRAYYMLNDIEGARLAFKDFLKYIKIENRKINDYDIINLVQYFDFIIKDKEKEIEEDLNYVLANFEFETPTTLLLLKLYVQSSRKDIFTVSEKDIDVDLIVDYANSNTKVITAFVASVLLRLGESDRAISYLKPHINTKFYTEELRLYCIALFHSNGSKLELREILKDVRENEVSDGELLMLEFELCRIMNDSDGILEIATEGVKRYPTSQRFNYLLLIAYEQSGKVDEAIRFSEKIDRISWTNEGIALQVVGCLFRIGRYLQSIELAYKIASNKDSIKARTAYASSFFHYPENVFSNPTVVELDAYVEVLINNEKHVIHVTKDNIKEPNVEILLGKTVKETFSIGSLLHGNYQTGIITNIRHRYSQLFYEIAEDSDNPLLNSPIKQFQLEGDDVESMKNSIIKHLGASAIYRKTLIQDSLNKFYNGELSFSNIAKAVLDDKLFEAYFAFTDNSSNGFRTIPSVNFKNFSASEFTICLDITSICLLYELSKQFNIPTVDVKYVISNNIKTILHNEKVQTMSSNAPIASMNVTMDDVFTTPYPENYQENWLKRYTELERWINDNCVYTKVVEKLDILAGKDLDISSDLVVSHASDSILLSQRENHVLVTLDTIYFLGFKEFTGRVISFENFISVCYPDIYLPTLKEMIKRKFIGVTIDTEIIRDEYLKVITNQQNNYNICIENLRYTWNPNPKHLQSSVKFLKWLCLLPYLPKAQKIRAVNQIFLMLLSTGDESVYIHLNSIVSEEFSLLHLYKDDILVELELIYQALRRNKKPH